MATKAELFRYRQERSGPKKEKSPVIRRDFPIDTSLPGVSQTDRRAGQGWSGMRNLSQRASQKAGYGLEDSKGKPSRKSTRRGKNRIKVSHTLRRVKAAQIRRQSRGSR